MSAERAELDRIAGDLRGLADRVQAGAYLTPDGAVDHPRIAAAALRAQDGGGAPYGWCPHCRAKGRLRERRPHGNDTCEAGHVYPSRAAVGGRG